MLYLTNEGRVVQKAIELEAQLEKVKEQLANAQNTISVLQVEIKDLQNQGRETSHGYDSDEEYDKVDDEFLTTPALRTYLDQMDAKNKRVHDEQQLQAREQREEGPATTNPTGKLSRPTAILTPTRRAARARSVARARAWRAQHRRATAAAAAVAAGMTEENETTS